MNRAVIFLALIFIFVAAHSAQAQKTSDWTIADYVKNLPEKYITASGDFEKPSAENIIADNDNGYAVAYEFLPPRPELDDEKRPTLEIALFKSQTKSPLLVVANRKSDSVCTDYETFFLRRVGDKWTEVSRDVLPPLDLKMFWDNPQSAARFKKIVEQDNSTTYHFEPPRQGTRMKVSLEICDYFLEETPIGQVEELTKIIESAKPLYLEWDKQNGKFKFAK